MVLSLNDIYKQDELFYWCNACGDINMPNTDPMSLHTEDELPMRERNLYENYWEEGAGCCMYVVRFREHPAMVLNYLFDKGYCEDLLGHEPTRADMHHFWVAIRDCAQFLERDERTAGCWVVVGEDTDPDGHELTVVVPYERRETIKDVLHYLNETVYASVEQLM